MADAYYTAGRTTYTRTHFVYVVYVRRLLIQLTRAGGGRRTTELRYCSGLTLLLLVDDGEMLMSTRTRTTV